MLKVLCGKIKLETERAPVQADIQGVHTVNSTPSDETGDEESSSPGAGLGSPIAEPTDSLDASVEHGSGSKTTAEGNRKKQRVGISDDVNKSTDSVAANLSSKMNVVTPSEATVTEDSSSLSALCFIAEVVTSNSKGMAGGTVPNGVNSSSNSGGFGNGSGKKVAAGLQPVAHFSAGAGVVSTTAGSSGSTNRRRSRASTMGSFFDHGSSRSGNGDEEESGQGSSPMQTGQQAAAASAGGEVAQSIESSAAGGSAGKPRRRRAGSIGGRSRSGSIDGPAADGAEASTVGPASKPPTCGSSSPVRVGGDESESDAASVARLLAGLSDSKAMDFSLSPVRCRSSSMGTRPQGTANHTALVKAGIAASPAIASGVSSAPGTAPSSTSHREQLSRTTVTSAAKFAGSTITFPRLNSDTYALRRQQLQQQQQQQGGAGSGTAAAPAAISAAVSVSSGGVPAAAVSTLPSSTAAPAAPVEGAITVTGTSTGAGQPAADVVASRRGRHRSSSDHSEGTTSVSSSSSIGHSSGSSNPSHSSGEDNDNELEHEQEVADDISSRYAAAHRVSAGAGATSGSADAGASGADSPMSATDNDSVPSPSPVTLRGGKKPVDKQSSSKARPRTRTMSVSVPMSLMSVNESEDEVASSAAVAVTASGASRDATADDADAEEDDEEDSGSCDSDSAHGHGRGSSGQSQYSNTSILRQFSCDNICENAPQNLSGLMLRSAVGAGAELGEVRGSGNVMEDIEAAAGKPDNRKFPSSSSSSSSTSEGDSVRTDTGDDNEDAGNVEVGGGGDLMDSSEYMLLLLNHAAAAAAADEGSVCGRAGAATKNGTSAHSGSNSHSRSSPMTDGNVGGSFSDGEGEGRADSNTTAEGVGGRTEGVNYIGVYSPDERYKRLLRFFSKRDRRVWTKRVKYDVRKNFADSRVRVKGRFVKKEDEEFLMKEHVETLVLGTSGPTTDAAAAPGTAALPAAAPVATTAGTPQVAVSKEETPQALAGGLNGSLMSKAPLAAAAAASPQRHVAAALITLADGL